MNAKTIKVVAYYRNSHSSQDRSVSQQREEVEKWAARFTTQAGERVKLIGEYIDAGISGDKADSRPGFKRLIADAKAGAFDGIVCWDQSRLGRFDMMDWGHFLWPVRQAGVRLFTCDRGESQWHDTIGQLLNGLETSGNKDYLKKLSKSVLRGKRQTVEDGNFAGGVAPYGYISMENKLAPVRQDKTYPKKLFIHPERAAIVREIFERYGRGEESMNAIARDLTQRGVPGPSDGIRKTKAAVAWGSRAIASKPVTLGRIRSLA